MDVVSLLIGWKEKNYKHNIFFRDKKIASWWILVKSQTTNLDASLFWPKEGIRVDQPQPLKDAPDSAY